MKKINEKEKLASLRILSLLISAGINFSKAIDTVVSQTKNATLKRVLIMIAKDIKSGKKISDAFAKHPDVFDPLLLTTMRTGEETGALSLVLDDYIGYASRLYELKKKTAQALRYPMFVLSVAAGVIVFMIYVVIPSFQDIFQSGNRELPSLTKLVVRISKFSTDHFFSLTILLILIIFIVRSLLKHKKFKNFVLSHIVLRLPVVKNIYLMNVAARFSFNMAVLLDRKVTLTDALRICRSVSQNPLYIKEVDTFNALLSRGSEIEKFLNKSVFFDSTFRAMFITGSQTGELSGIFKFLSEYYTGEFDEKVSNITSILEPALILILGTIISIILAALYLPLFENIGSFGI